MDRGAWQATSPWVRKESDVSAHARMSRQGSPMASRNAIKRKKEKERGWEGAKEDEMKTERMKKQKFQEPQESRVDSPQLNCAGQQASGNPHTDHSKRTHQVN